MKKYLMMGAAALILGGATFTSCSSDKDLYDAGKVAEQNLLNYEKAFKMVFGEIASDQTWGFGAPAASRMTRSGNTSGDYTPWPYTHGYEDANGNLIASANMNHNQWGSSDLQSMPFGGWIVPDPLTAGQKLRVQKYFQANPNLSYQDPYYANFYVQQVYTGGTSAPETGNKESTAAADGTVHAGSTLNQLTVGAACSHINDFNAGTCTTSQVLNHEGKTQNDEITLMLNVDDTSCFGYHETGGSNVKGVINHNDKMALVSAATIDAWAAANGNPGEAVTDKWNRSFMGFDYELLPESDIVTEEYARLDAVPNLNNIPYAWDGQKVMTIGATPENTETTTTPDFDLMPYFAAHVSSNNATCTTVDGKIVCTFGQWYGSLTFGQGNQDWSPYSKLVVEFEASPISGTIMNTAFNVGDTKVEVALNNEHWWNDDQGPTIVSQDGTLTITSVKLIGKTIEGQTYNAADYYNPTYLLGDADGDKIAFYSRNTNMYGGIVLNLTEDEMKTTQDGKTCLNLVKFRELKNDGYHPITSDLKTWVKWQAACDGYYSDWIVTLTEARRQDTTPAPRTNPFLRVIAEDLTANERGDFDFNDIVFDVEYVSASEVTVTIQAAGGTLPLTINGQEVHQLFIAANPGAVTDQGGEINVKTMINTNAIRINPQAPYSSAELENLPTFTLMGTWSDDQETFSAQVRDYIPLVVTKTSEDGNTYTLTLTAEKGKTPGKVGIASPYYNWKEEKVYIGDGFKKFVSDPTYAMWWKE